MEDDDDDLVRAWAFTLPLPRTELSSLFLSPQDFEAIDRAVQEHAAKSAASGPPSMPHHCHQQPHVPHTVGYHAAVPVAQQAPPYTLHGVPLQRQNAPRAGGTSGIHPHGQPNTGDPPQQQNQQKQQQNAWDTSAAAWAAPAMNQPPWQVPAGPAHNRMAVPNRAAASGQGPAQQQQQQQQPHWQAQGHIIDNARSQLSHQIPSRQFTGHQLPAVASVMQVHRSQQGPQGTAHQSWGQKVHVPIHSQPPLQQEKQLQLPSNRLPLAPVGGGTWGGQPAVSSTPAGGQGMLGTAHPVAAQPAWQQPAGGFWANGSAPHAAGFNLGPIAAAAGDGTGSNPRVPSNGNANGLRQQQQQPPPCGEFWSNENLAPQPTLMLPHPPMGANQPYGPATSWGMQQQPPTGGHRQRPPEYDPAGGPQPFSGDPKGGAIPKAAPLPSGSSNPNQSQWEERAAASCSVSHLPLQDVSATWDGQQPGFSAARPSSELQTGRRPQQQLAPNSWQQQQQQQRPPPDTGLVTASALCSAKGGVGNAYPCPASSAKSCDGGCCKQRQCPP